MIEGSVLVLNRRFTPVTITSLKRAVCLVFKGLAKVVDEGYQIHDFASWRAISAAKDEDAIHLTNGNMRVPRVILLQFYEKLPYHRVRLCRENIYLRDKSTCQYCGRRFSRSELNLDHVVPLSQGGRTTWDNVVCSCIACNHHKGGRTPAMAGLKLLTKPTEPAYSLFRLISPQESLFDAWRVYMHPIDFAYWNLELRKT